MSTERRQPGEGTASCRRRGGAYGLGIRGVAIDPTHLISAPAHWPDIELRVEVTPSPPQSTEHLNGETATLRMRTGGTVVVDRQAERATFLLRERPPAAALVHPHLASVAAVSAHWCGRDALHAGAFVLGGGVWGLLGDKGAGKSSTLAALARAGVPILSDDVLILDNGTAFAGPRSIDLRQDAATALTAGRPLGAVGGRERWRVALDQIAPELPLRGWVTLRWSDELQLRDVHGSARLREILRHRALRVPPSNPASLLELAGQPMLEFGRPRAWASIDQAVRHLADSLS